MRINSWALLAALPILASCAKDDPKTSKGNNGDYANGMFITNEGPFQGGNGTLSFYNTTDGTLENDVFASVNLRPLGNVVHSMSISGDQAFIVVNNSGVVEIVDADDMSSNGTITGLQQPRYAVGIGANEVAISNWGSNSVEFYNTTSQSLVASVNVNTGPERMLLHNGMLYVANSGGFGLDSTVTVIETATHTVVDTLYTGYNPNGIAIDANGDLWVLCGGYTDWNDASNNEDGSIHRYDMATGAEELGLVFPSADRPTGLTLDASGQVLYYLSNGYGGTPFSLDITATALNTTSLVPGASLYSMGYNDVDGELYLGDAVDYASSGKVYRYDISSQAVVDTLTVGIIPGNYAFNK
ncbi:MAG: hypothetical protein EP346_06660 [Bacteroidetes bacterium]|nr:MAG: hypothetical protein EP346_06660 [Bacteroidota bacterium]